MTTYALSEGGLRLVSSWRDQAACSIADDVDPETAMRAVQVFYPIVEDELQDPANPVDPNKAWRSALQFCRWCPSAMPCLIEAVTKPEPLGIRAGLGSDARRELRRVYLEHGIEALRDLASEHVVQLRAGNIQRPDLQPEPVESNARASIDERRANWQHGSRSAINRGCHCDTCKLGSAMYSRRRRHETDSQQKAATK